MELCFLKSNALDTLKKSLPQTFKEYFMEQDNSWLIEICEENPFGKFRNVPDFELTPLDKGLTPGEIDLNNSKILYKNLRFLTPYQAADERLWAGLCHGAFYDYVRRRWGYDKAISLSSEKAVDEIKTRFFFSDGSRQSLWTNTLSKYWWAGHIFSSEGLDILGAKDFYTKIFSIGTRSFIGNKNLRNGFIKFLQHFKAQGIELDIKAHIRPAMSELNKNGGAVILDCLTEEEIAAIMIEYVEKSFTEKSSTKIDAAETGKFVEDGDKVFATSLVGGSTKTFKVAKKYLMIYREIVGKQINSVFEVNGVEWKITGIKKI